MEPRVRLLCGSQLAPLVFSLELYMAMAFDVHGNSIYRRCNTEDQYVLQRGSYRVVLAGPPFILLEK